MLYANAAHNTVFPVDGKDAPEWLTRGVRWDYAEARAWPLHKRQAFSEDVLGPSRSLATMAQWVGNVVNVSAVGGIVYAGSDDMFVYALNARTGKLIWRTSPVSNTYMSTPLVVGDTVYVSTGNVAFTFHQTKKYARDPGSAARGAGTSYNGIAALDRRSGKLRWFFSTKGEVMPTPAYYKGTLIVNTGAGIVHAIDAHTGKQVWRHDLGGMGNMSSPVVYKDKVYLGMAVKPQLYCLDASSGKALWSSHIPGETNTGMGDVTPAVADGVVVMDSVTFPATVKGKATMNTRVRAFNADTGEVLWQDDVGRGPKPQSFKGGVPMIHDGVVYLGDPVRSIYQALDLHSGKVKWTWKVPQPSPAGNGRGPAAWYRGTLYIASNDRVHALDPKTGTELGSYHVGGRFPIMSPTIVGGTMYLGNGWDWVHAVPLAAVTAKQHS